MDRLERWAPLTGIAAVGLIVDEALISGDTPTIDDPATDITAFWRDNVRTQEISTGLMALSAIAFGWSGASLRSALRELAGEERLGSIAQAGSVIIAIGLSVYASVGQAVVHSVGDVPASVTQTLAVLSGADLYVFLAVVTALMVLSVATATLRHGGLPRWFGWVSLVLGVVGVIVVFIGAIAPGLGYAAWLLSVLWIPTVAILLYRRQPVAA